MKCHYCGEEIPAGEIFCRYCGTRQNQPAVPEQSAGVQPEASHSVPPASQPQPEAQTAPVSAAPQPQNTYRPAESEQPRRQESQERPAYSAVAAPARRAPVLQLPTERGLAKMFFLGILTLGIYPMVIWSRMVTELNLAASRYDGERTMPYFAMCTLAPITLFIYALVWIHGFCRRIGTELQRRNLNYKFGASSYWLWCVLGMLILVGPLVFVHKLTKAMNLINRDYNVNG